MGAAPGRDFLLGVGDKRTEVTAANIGLHHNTAFAVFAADLVRALGNLEPCLHSPGEVARFEIAEGPNQISRENGKRRIVVQANIRGRDLGSFVADAQQQIAAQVPLPAGSWLDWGGQFENLVAARQRLSLVVPLCFFLIFLLLFSAFNRSSTPCWCSPACRSP